MLSKIHFKSIALVFLLGLLFASCRSNYALFQESSTPRYQRIANKTLRFKTRKLQAKRAFIKHKTIKLDRIIIPPPTYFPEIKVENPHVSIPALILLPTAKSSIKPDPKTKEKIKRKKKRKRQNFWRHAGSNLVIGVLFLAIAITLTILNLETLALLFGIASLLFLIFGLKKIFKKRRLKIRNPFEKNDK